MNRAEFKEKAKDTIEELFDQVDALENRAEDVKSEASEEYDEKIRQLRKQKEVLTNKFKQLENATEDNWEKMQTAITNGVRAFKKTLEN